MRRYERRPCPYPGAMVDGNENVMGGGEGMETGGEEYDKTRADISGEFLLINVGNSVAGRKLLI